MATGTGPSILCKEEQNSLAHSAEALGFLALLREVKMPPLAREYDATDGGRSSA